MNEQMIGEVAGEVWRYLERNGGRAELGTLRNSIRQREGVSADLGTGCLAREGKVSFETERGSVHVALRR